MGPRLRLERAGRREVLGRERQALARKHLEELAVAQLAQERARAAPLRADEGAHVEAPAVRPAQAAAASRATGCAPGACKLS